MKARSPIGPAFNVSRNRKEGDRDTHSGFFSIDRDYAFADMLLAENGGVSAPQPGVLKNIEHDALARAARPTSLELGDVVFAMAGKSISRGSPIPSSRRSFAAGRKRSILQIAVYR